MDEPVASGGMEDNIRMAGTIDVHEAKRNLRLTFNSIHLKTLHLIQGSNVLSR